MNGKRDDLYKCNHHHPIKDDQRFMSIGGEEVVVDNNLALLIASLNDAGLRTRTHCGGHGSGHKFLSIILGPHVHIEFKHVNEPDANRDTYRGEKEMLIMWRDSDG